MNTEFLTIPGAVAPGREHLTVPDAVAPGRESLVAPGAGAPGREPRPTSFAQRRLWFLDRLERGGTAYHVPVAVRLRGPLDVTALRRALTAVVDRHEVLRTTFHEVDGEPVQLPGTSAPVPLAVRDLRGATEPGGELAAALRAGVDAPFDLTTRPPLRAELLRLGSEEHVLLVTAHHIVMDGWSLDVLFRELTALYSAALTGRPAGLPELAVQYADFAAWQREHLGVQALEAEVVYWRERLAGAPPALDLPTEFPRPKRWSGAGAVATARWPAGLVADVEELSGAHGVTVFMTLLAAFQAVLSRYSGSLDVVVGSAVAGRVRSELEPLIGCFINTLPLRTDLSGEPSFAELLSRVRGVALGGYQHQNLSFEQIVDVVQPDRGAARTPVFQVMFAVNHDAAPLEFEGLEVELVPAYRSMVKYDLNATVTLAGGDARVAVEYRTDLFGPAWMERFLGHYRRLVEAAVADPDRAITALPLLSARQRRQLVDQWNDTLTEFPAEATVHELVERRVDTAPDALAVVAEDGRLTYRELDALANRLAHRLRALGVEPGSRVGLLLERCRDLPVAVLGVLKAGCAYVPLDPAYPAQRLEFMAADAGVRAVLTHAPVRDRVPAAVPVVVDLSRPCPEDPPEGVPEDVPEDLPDGRIEAGAGPTDSAYVIYTSGSTGQPKGVVNNHRGLVNRLIWMQREYRLDASDVVLQKTPYTFDVSVWEFLWPLLAGARLVMARPGGHRDPRYLRGLVNAEGVTTLHFVPSMLQAFMEVVDVRDCPSLRRVFCSGEALPTALARAFLATAPGVALVNLYGPTEAAIDVSQWTCRPDDPEPTVPIGRPIANTRLYVLDPRGEPVPVGVPGELYIGGVQVADGYVNRPELTAERFVRNPFHDGRMYRTGDLSRWRPDGAIEFLGRLDDQVKLRGLRIELGEVAAALRAQEPVRDAVVVVRDQSLVGYVVCAPDRFEPVQLRRRLAEVLPEYMVPAALVRLDALPLSPNGKVDRRALPEADDAPLDGVRVAARDGVELELVALWEELLQRRPIGVRDDFFALGGTSLQVIRLLGRVYQRYGRDLPVSVMFSGGATVEQLAREVRREPGASLWSPVVAIRAAGTRPPVFCLPPAVGNALCYLDLARHLPPEQPVYGLQAVGLDPGQQPLGRLDDAVEHYVRAIRSVQPAGPYRLVGYCVGTVTAYAVAQRLRERGDPVALLALIDGGPPSPDGGFERADEAEIAAWFGWELARAAGRRLEIPAQRLRGKQGPALADAVREHAIAADVLPPDTEGAHIARLLATFTATVRAIRDHRLCGYDGPVLALRAADEPTAPSPVWRWRAFAADLVVEEVPGDHYTIMRPPHVEALAEALDRALARVGTDGS